MTAFRSHTRAKTSTPLFDCVVNHALVQALHSSMIRCRNSSTFSCCKLASEGLPIFYNSQSTAWWIPCKWAKFHYFVYTGLFCTNKYRRFLFLWNTVYKRTVLTLLQFPGCIFFLCITESVLSDFIRCNIRSKRPAECSIFSKNG